MSIHLQAVELTLLIDQGKIPVQGCNIVHCAIVRILQSTAISVILSWSPAFAADKENMEVATETSVANLAYPDTRKVDLVEEQFGVKVADPYRWLEDDVRNSKSVADWVAAQKAVADPYLESLRGKEALAARMRALFDYERFSIPQKSGGHYFFTKNDGLQNQSR